ncbi:MAG: DNA-processing protein DprA, partial [Clostridia bacterium]|nr:DNA-processing protein DprA [Clostridia bacterium]
AVIRDGCVLSEYAPGTEPAGFRFPVRNRIISGLSVATVVVEVDAGSGSLITARHAAYQGRAVFAVPGRVGTPGSSGTNNLLKNGALVATSAEDILAEYEFTFPHSVSVGACRNALRGVDISEAAEEAVNRMRVSSRGSGNYYGKGTYGGKKLPAASRPKNEKPKDEKVRLGDLSEDLPAGFVRVGRKSEPTEPRRIDLDMLDEVNIRVYNLMTPDVPVTADELVRPDLPVSEVLSSMSALELAGAIEAGAGGYYLRRGSDDLNAPEE